MDGGIFLGNIFLGRIFGCIFNHGCRCVGAGYLGGQAFQVSTYSPCAQARACSSVRELMRDRWNTRAWFLSMFREGEGGLGSRLSEVERESGNH